MFVEISNTPRPYAWGSSTAIADLLGTAASGGPEAELWLGAHPGNPSTVVPDGTGLDAWLAEHGFGELPFLLKVLAAAAPLSLQAHPTTEQARAGYARENAAGVPLDAADRNYKDPFAKPEMIYALSERFDALCGFRPVAASRADFEALLDVDAARVDPQPQPIEDLLDRLTDDALPEVFEWLISSGAGVATLVSVVTELATSAGPAIGTASAFETVRMLAEGYPGDPGIVISLLLNRVSLRRGEALYLPAGNIHAYLNGLGVELMGASDNVLRGGLTPKHVDVPELLSVLDFTPVEVPYLRPTADGVFRPAGAGFELRHVTASSRLELSSPAIALCTAGSFTLAGGESTSTFSLERGHAALITPDELTLGLSGAGELFVATAAA